MSKFKKLVSSLWTAFWPVLIELFRDKFVEASLKKVLGVTLAATSFRAWLVKFLAKHFFDEIILPSANIALIEVNYIIDKHEGKVLVKRIEEADNAQDYNDAVDDIMS